ncbi:MAG: 16S rRNA (cytosine(967)-C(5))-methyltransferase RsmB [Clostridiales bacterium]|jgi:16S rRNA (cytosine967-C5)-methyltransferase|nr:16S rRNA (cytosine(967)-C(5))-methyltransferase RsmB [Clostridiales bacterium]
MQGEREVAARALMEIFEKKSYGNVALRHILARHDHFGRVQKAFVTEIVSGCIRNLTQIDHIIGHFSRLPPGKMKPAIVNILRISVYQMRFMDKVPIFAICNEAVALAKKMGFVRLSGFINGVLRNIARNLNEPPPPDLLEIKYSCAPWIAAHLAQELGADAAEAMLANVCKPPNVTLCVNTRKISPQALLERLAEENVEAGHGNLVDGALVVTKTSDIAALASFQEGCFHVMDQAAMLAVIAAAPSKNTRIIDVCAAPGGKSFLAAYLARDAHIISRDIHDFKLDMLEKSIARLSLNGIFAEKWDATVFDESLRDSADLVIVDAPCSGLGTMRRRPDIKLFKPADSIDGLVALQRNILEASRQYVKPGGKLLYSTCTINSAENMENVKWFLEKFPFRPMDFGANIPNVPEFITAKDGHLQILPQYFDTDGFFIAVFERE